MTATVTDRIGAKPTRAYVEWERRLDGRVLTMAQARQFAKAISTAALGYNRTGAKTNLTDEECKVLYQQIRNEPCCLTTEDDTKGLEWLVKYGAKAFKIAQTTVEHVSHFTYNGAIWVEPRNAGYIDGVDAYPMWTVHSVLNGEPFGRYFRIPWQAQRYNGTGETGKFIFI